jgi:membrane-associated phospholipid phosphatase
MESRAPARHDAAASPGFEARRPVWPVDVLQFVFLPALLAVTVAFHERIAHAGRWIAFDALGIVALVLIGRLGTTGSPRRGALLRLAHGAVAVPLVFTQVGFVIHGVRPVDYAALLERCDRILFVGANPVEALERVSHPVLTEAMQWAYTSYLLLPIGLVLLLAWKAGGEEISRSLFSLLGAMYLSYVGYVLVPAAGPNIHCNLGPPGPVAIDVIELYRFETTLAGTWITQPLREWMFAVELTKKDCFPSGHVAVAIVCWILARRVHRRSGPLFLVLALGVTASTVYLRYHYVVDVVAGILLAWFALTGWSRAHDWLGRRLRYDS